MEESSPAVSRSGSLPPGVGTPEESRPPPSPLSGAYLLVIISEPRTDAHKAIILQKLAKAFLSWNTEASGIDIERELAIVTALSPEGDFAKNGERLIQNASEHLVTEILIHPQVNTMRQCIRNLLSSFTKYRFIIHSGYVFCGNGSWILQDGTFSTCDFIDTFQEIEVQRVIRAYEKTVKIDICCISEGTWNQTRINQESFTKICHVEINPSDKISPGNVAVREFVDYMERFIVPSSIEELLEPSDIVGNIRFTHPTLYVFPGGEGDAALFGINGFNMLVDGGFSRKACFWNFVRHLDRLDGVLLTRINNNNMGGMSGIVQRKVHSHVYPQIGHFFSNLQTKRNLPSPDGDKDKEPLLVDLIEEGHKMVLNLKQLELKPHHCYRDSNSEPINLYHKVGHGKLDMYVISPAKDSKEVKEFLSRWNNYDVKLFSGTTKSGSRELRVPLQNLVSICALLVWQPANPEDHVTRILFPGGAPQHKIFEGFEKMKPLEFLKNSICTMKSITPVPVTTLKKQRISPTEIITDSLHKGEGKHILGENEVDAIHKPDPDIKKMKPRKLVEKPVPKEKTETKTAIQKTVEKTTDSSDIVTPKIEEKKKLESKKLVSKPIPERKFKPLSSLGAADKKSGSEKSSPTTPKRVMTSAKVISEATKEVASIKSTQEVSKSHTVQPTPETKRSTDMRTDQVTKATVHATVEHVSTKEKISTKEQTQIKESVPTKDQSLAKEQISKSSAETSKSTVKSTTRMQTPPKHFTAAKSLKDENNRKVAEAKKETMTRTPPKMTTTLKPAAPKKAEDSNAQKVEKKTMPVKRTKPPAKAPPMQTSAPVAVKKVVPIRPQKMEDAKKSMKTEVEITDSSAVSMPSTVDTKAVSALPKKTELLKTEKTADKSAEVLASVDGELKQDTNVTTYVSNIYRKEGPGIDDDDDDEILVIETTEIKSVYYDEQKYLRDEKESEKKKDEVGLGEDLHKHKTEVDKLSKDNLEKIPLTKETLTDVKTADTVLSKGLITPEEKDKITDEVEVIITTATKIISVKDSDTKSTDDDQNKREIEKDEKITFESASTTTAPTIPEDEKVDDIAQDVEEKYDKEETKEKSADAKYKSEISTEDQKVEEIKVKSVLKKDVKTPDEVADLPVDEETEQNLSQEKTDHMHVLDYPTTTQPVTDILELKHAEYVTITPTPVSSPDEKPSPQQEYPDKISNVKIPSLPESSQPQLKHTSSIAEQASEICDTSVSEKLKKEDASLHEEAAAIKVTELTSVKLADSKLSILTCEETNNVCRRMSQENAELSKISPEQKEAMTEKSMENEYVVKDKLTLQDENKVLQKTSTHLDLALESSLPSSTTKDEEYNADKLRKQSIIHIEKSDAKLLKPIDKSQSLPKDSSIVIISNEEKLATEDKVERKDLSNQITDSQKTSPKKTESKHEFKDQLIDKLDGTNNIESESLKPLASSPEQKSDSNQQDSLETVSPPKVHPKTELENNNKSSTVISTKEDTGADIEKVNVYSTKLDTKSSSPENKIITDIIANSISEKSLNHKEKMIEKLTQMETSEAVLDSEKFPLKKQEEIAAQSKLSDIFKTEEDTATKKETQLSSDTSPSTDEIKDSTNQESREKIDSSQPQHEFLRKYSLKSPVNEKISPSEIVSAITPSGKEISDEKSQRKLSITQISSEKSPEPEISSKKSPELIVDEKPLETGEETISKIHPDTQRKLSLPKSMTEPPVKDETNKFVEKKDYSLEEKLHLELNQELSAKYISHEEIKISDDSLTVKGGEDMLSQGSTANEERQIFPKTELADQQKTSSPLLEKESKTEMLTPPTEKEQTASDKDLMKKEIQTLKQSSIEVQPVEPKSESKVMLPTDSVSYKATKDESPTKQSTSTDTLDEELKELPEMSTKIDYILSIKDVDEHMLKLEKMVTSDTQKNDTSAALSKTSVDSNKISLEKEYKFTDKTSIDSDVSVIDIKNQYSTEVEDKKITTTKTDDVHNSVGERDFAEIKDDSQIPYTEKLDQTDHEKQYEYKTESPIQSQTDVVKSSVTTDDGIKSLDKNKCEIETILRHTDYSKDLKKEELDTESSKESSKSQNVLEVSISHQKESLKILDPDQSLEIKSDNILSPRSDVSKDLDKPFDNKSLSVSSKLPSEEAKIDSELSSKEPTHKQEFESKKDSLEKAVSPIDDILKSKSTNDISSKALSESPIQEKKVEEEVTRVQNLGKENEVLDSNYKDQNLPEQPTQLTDSGRKNSLEELRDNKLYQAELSPGTSDTKLLAEKISDSKDDEKKQPISDTLTVEEKKELELCHMKVEDTNKIPSEKYPKNLFDVKGQQEKPEFGVHKLQEIKEKSKIEGESKVISPTASGSDDSTEELTKVEKLPAKFEELASLDKEKNQSQSEAELAIKLPESDDQIKETKMSDLQDSKTFLHDQSKSHDNSIEKMSPFRRSSIISDTTEIDSLVHSQIFKEALGETKLYEEEQPNKPERIEKLEDIKTTDLQKESVSMQSKVQYDSIENISKSRKGSILTDKIEIVSPTDSQILKKALSEIKSEEKEEPSKIKEIINLQTTRGVPQEQSEVHLDSNEEIIRPQRGSTITAKTDTDSCANSEVVEAQTETKSQVIEQVDRDTIESIKITDSDSTKQFPLDSKYENYNIIVEKINLAQSDNIDTDKVVTTSFTDSEVSKADAEYHKKEKSSNIQISEECPKEHTKIYDSSVEKMTDPQISSTGTDKTKTTSSIDFGKSEIKAQEKEPLHKAVDNIETLEDIKASDLLRSQRDSVVADKIETMSSINSEVIKETKSEKKSPENEKLNKKLSIENLDKIKTIDQQTDPKFTEKQVEIHDDINETIRKSQSSSIVDNKIESSNTTDSNMLDESLPGTMYQERKYSDKEIKTNNLQTVKEFFQEQIEDSNISVTSSQILKESHSETKSCEADIMKYNKQVPEKLDTSRSSFSGPENGTDISENLRISTSELQNSKEILIRPEGYNLHKSAEEITSELILENAAATEALDKKNLSVHRDSFEGITITGDYPTDNTATFTHTFNKVDSETLSPDLSKLKEKATELDKLSEQLANQKKTSMTFECESIIGEETAQPDKQLHHKEDVHSSHPLVTQKEHASPTTEQTRKTSIKEDTMQPSSSRKSSVDRNLESMDEKIGRMDTTTESLNNQTVSYESCQVQLSKPQEDVVLSHKSDGEKSATSTTITVSEKSTCKEIKQTIKTLKDEFGSHDIQVEETKSKSPDTQLSQNKEDKNTEQKDEEIMAEIVREFIYQEKKAIDDANKSYTSQQHDYPQGKCDMTSNQSVISQQESQVYHATTELKEDTHPQRELKTEVTEKSDTTSTSGEFIKQSIQKEITCEKSEIPHLETNHDFIKTVKSTDILTDISKLPQSTHESILESSQESQMYHATTELKKDTHPQIELKTEVTEKSDTTSTSGEFIKQSIQKEVTCEKSEIPHLETNHDFIKTVKSTDILTDISKLPQSTHESILEGSQESQMYHATTELKKDTHPQIESKTEVIENTDTTSRRGEFIKQSIQKEEPCEKSEILFLEADYDSIKIEKSADISTETSKLSQSIHGPISENSKECTEQAKLTTSKEDSSEGTKIIFSKREAAETFTDSKQNEESPQSTNILSEKSHSSHINEEKSKIIHETYVTKEPTYSANDDSSIPEDLLKELAKLEPNKHESSHTIYQSDISKSISVEKSNQGKATEQLQEVTESPLRKFTTHIEETITSMASDTVRKLDDKVDIKEFLQETSDHSKSDSTETKTEYHIEKYHEEPSERFVSDSRSPKEQFHSTTYVTTAFSGAADGHSNSTVVVTSENQVKGDKDTTSGVESITTITTSTPAIRTSTTFDRRGSQPLGFTETDKGHSPELQLDPAQMRVKFTTDRKDDDDSRRFALKCKSNSEEFYDSSSSGQDVVGDLSSKFEKREPVGKTVSLPILDEKFEDAKTSVEVEKDEDFSRSYPYLEKISHSEIRTPTNLSDPALVQQVEAELKLKSVSMPVIERPDDSERYMTLPHLYKTNNLEDLTTNMTIQTTAVQERRESEDGIAEVTTREESTAIEPITETEEPIEDSCTFVKTIRTFIIDDESDEDTTITTTHTSDGATKDEIKIPSHDEKSSSLKQISTPKSEISAEQSPKHGTPLDKHGEDNTEFALHTTGMSQMSASMTQSFYGSFPDSDSENDHEKSENKSEINIAESTKLLGDSMKKDPIGDWGKPMNLPEARSMSTLLVWNPLEDWGKPLGLPSPTPSPTPSGQHRESNGDVEINLMPINSKTTPKKTVKKSAEKNHTTRNTSKSRDISTKKFKSSKQVNPLYVDLAYVPHHGNPYYTTVDFFKRIRARYYVFSGTDPSKEVFNALLEGKKSWENQDLEVTIISTYDTDVLGYWITENEETLANLKIDLAPSASRCTINLQDHDTSCSAYRLEF